METTAPIQATLEALPLRQLEERWGISRNALKSRAKALGIELLRPSSTVTLWPGEFLDLGDQLHEHLQKGLPMHLFPGTHQSHGTGGSDGQLTHQQPGTATSDLAVTPPAGAIEALASAITAMAPTPPADPLWRAEKIARAADLGVPLTSQELADIAGVAVSTVQKWSDGHALCPGFTLSREKSGNTLWWSVTRQRPGTATSRMALTAADERPSIGFGAAAVDVSHRVIEPGPSLFPLC